MATKVGYFTLATAISLVLYDKGPMTKAECFEIFKPLEITNAEFDEAWKHECDWGFIRPAFRTGDKGQAICNYRAEDSISIMARFIPRLWENILGDSSVKQYDVTVTCKEMHKDRVLKGMEKVAGIMDVKYKE